MQDNDFKGIFTANYNWTGHEEDYSERVVSQFCYMAAKESILYFSYEDLDASINAC